VRFAFARFFPAVPIEAYLTRPVFHPNVHPTTGFVCLWSRFSKADTVIEALCRLHTHVGRSCIQSTPMRMQPAKRFDHGVGLGEAAPQAHKPSGWMNVGMKDRARQVRFNRHRGEKRAKANRTSCSWTNSILPFRFFHQSKLALGIVLGPAGIRQDAALLSRGKPDWPQPSGGGWSIRCQRVTAQIHS